VTTFDLPRDLDAAGGRLLLDLGDVREVAEVRLNGRDLGVVWKAPFRVDTNDAVRPRGNWREVGVVNPWRNRLSSVDDPAYRRRILAQLNRGRGASCRGTCDLTRP
jgi:hypothetical protein